MPLRSSALLASATGALFLSGLLMGPAQAAPVTSTGARCTIVGTAGPDVLVGTPGRDVICGRGGSDVIRSGGGDDLVDAGTGSDLVVAGSGDDRVLAGAGADQVLGGDGADRVSAGDGADTVEGGAGADTLSGGDGSDVLNGDGGADTVNGGNQDDQIDGGSQGDDLAGNGGNDDLTGDGGADSVDGGVGDNICIVDAADESIRCRYDEEPPVAAETVLDAGSVDVTNSDVPVTVRVRATDDTGVTTVQGWFQDGNNGVAVRIDTMELVSGTDRDGWWEGTLTVPRWTAPGVLYGDITVTDRQGRSGSTPYSGGPQLQVADADPDVQGPQMAVQQLAPDTIDVRTGAKTVTVSLHVTDAPAGVGQLEICLGHPSASLPSYADVACDENPTRSSGTIRDGIWTSTLTVPKGSVGATYNVEAYAVDRASNDVRWMGPDAYQQWTDGHVCCVDAFLFPGDAGRVQVIGTVADATPARIDEVTASKTQLDTLAAADRTTVSVHAVDAAGEGEGVTAVEALLVSDQSLASDPQFPVAGLQLTSGSVTDGWWQGDVVAPQGTPPDSYHLLVAVTDRAHSTGYTDPTGPDADGVTYQPLDGMPTITVLDTRP